MHIHSRERAPLQGALAALAPLLVLPAAGLRIGACPLDIGAWAEKRVAEQLAPWAETGITEAMVEHARSYWPRWRKPGIIQLVFDRGGSPHLVTDGLDVGTRAWLNYTRRAVERWPFGKEELREFKVAVQRGDFPMLLKDDPKADPSLNAPLFANTNNGKFWEVLMPVAWRPQFGDDFAAKRAESLSLARQHPWRERQDVAVWRGVVGCATGCGARGQAYFPQGTVDTCYDDQHPDWDADAVGATWGCGDDAASNRSSAWMKHPRVELVGRYGGTEGRSCGMDVGFHTWQRHGAFLRRRVERGVLESWMKGEMEDKETANYRYVFHVGNNGYADRSWRMFALGATVLLVDNGWQEFYFSLLKPWVHYIPVKPDASDACEQVQWARAHPEEAERIAASGRDFVEHCLTESAIDRYVAEMVRQLGRLWAVGRRQL